MAESGEKLRPCSGAEEDRRTRKVKLQDRLAEWLLRMEPGNMSCAELDSLLHELDQVAPLPDDREFAAEDNLALLHQKCRAAQQAAPGVDLPAALSGRRGGGAPAHHPAGAQGGLPAGERFLLRLLLRGGRSQPGARFNSLKNFTASLSGQGIDSFVFSSGGGMDIFGGKTIQADGDPPSEACSHVAAAYHTIEKERP